MAHLIAAIATALSPSAIGILRLSGDDCFSVLSKVFFPKNGAAVHTLPDRLLTLGTLRDRDGAPLDEVLCCISRGPHSYTGEDTAELQCHGSPAVLAAGLEALFAAGARQAGPGEFTRRAFLNGRMDLSQAEAVIDLIDAQSREAARNAAGQLGGALRRRVEPVCEALTDILAHFHAVLDYPDEEIPPFQLSAFAAQLESHRESLAALERSFQRGQYLRTGVPAVILGSPNAGKSSLLNALAGYERVIVTDIPGTTRDTVEEALVLGGQLVRLTDTAGIRDTGDRVEQIGVRRSRDAAKAARLAIFVCDGSRPLTREDRDAMEAAQSAPLQLGVINKSDLPLCLTAADLPFDTVVTLSAREGQGLDRLEAAVSRLLSDGTVPDGGVITNARQLAAITEAGRCLDAVLASLYSGMTPDAVLTDAEAALTALGEITGQSMREEVVSRIFQRFCVGK